MNSLTWQLTAFSELSLAHWYAISQARMAVFVVEQNCPYQDLDDKDAHSWHLSGWVDGKLAAYLRLLPPGVSYQESSIGRVLTTPGHRRGGYGRALMREGIEQSERLWGRQAIRIGAQRYLESFYGSFGFVTASEPYDEDGIEHIIMLRA